MNNSPRTSPRHRGNRHPIAAARMAAGLTQAQLAEKVGCLCKDISNYERGVIIPRADRLAAIAKALGVPMESLLPIHSQ